jgi:hypothetical protein
MLRPSLSRNEFDPKALALALPVGVDPDGVDENDDAGVEVEAVDFALCLPGIVTELDGPEPEPDAAAGVGLGKIGRNFDPPVVVPADPVD